MINANLDFCTSEEWQHFMNNDIIITLGQPVIKADKSTALLSIEQKCNIVTDAQPKVKGFAKSKNRLYLPLSYEQVHLFLLNKKELESEVKYLKHNCIIKASNSWMKVEASGRTWYEASATLFLELRKVGKLK